MTSDERRMRRFSEEFRREQVKLIESGQATIAEVSRLYEVKRENVRQWLRKFGKKPVPEIVRIQTAEEANRVRDLEKEVGKLNAIIGKLHVELIYKDELIALAKEKLGEGFEKKTKS